ncbi:MAG: desulfoferrodoxin family protein [Sandaracinaceae bacterium]
MRGLFTRRDLAALLLSGALLGLAPIVGALAYAQDAPPDHEPADPTRMTPEERRHVPVLGLPSQVRVDRPFDVMVQVGLETHPMRESHHIDHIEVQLDGQKVFDATLSPSVGYPVVRVPLVVSESATLTVRAHCNLHGTWRTQRALEAR